jgi:hypothetical protein
VIFVITVEQLVHPVELTAEAMALVIVSIVAAVGVVPIKAEVGRDER